MLSKRALKGLQGSIKKWEKIVGGTGTDKGAHNCPLCKLYYKEGSCETCPVFKKTGETDCHDTPWEPWATHQRKKHEKSCHFDSLSIMCPTCKGLAREELNFLKSLLEK